MEPTRLNIKNNVIPINFLNGNEIFPNEEFRNVIYYDGTIIPWYYISNYGRIWSVNYGKFLSYYQDQGGYYRVTLVINSNGNTVFTGVHKITLMSFDPILESDYFIPHHKDDNKINNHINNLQWATVSENTRFALESGAAYYTGENNPRSYLSNDQINMICKMLEEGYKPPEIATNLGDPYDKIGDDRNKMCAIIRNIRAGKSYYDIATNYNIPGLQGRKFYSLEFTMLVCNFLSDPNRIFTFRELCEYLCIDLNDRKMFRDYVDDILKGKVHKDITKNYTLHKYIFDVSESDPTYCYYI